VVRKKIYSDIELLKTKLEKAEKQIISQDLAIAELETELSKKQKGLDRLNQEELKFVYKDYINSLKRQIDDQRDIIGENKNRMKEQLTYLENNYTKLLQKYKEFRNSIVYPLYRFTHNLGETKIGQILQRLLK